MLPEPKLTRDDTRGLWIVDKAMTVPADGYTLVVPQGFETDLASVPRSLWPLIAPFELSCVGPIVHDFLYQHGGLAFTLTGLHRFTRAESDGILLELMTQEQVPAWRRQAAYYAVRLFGGTCWQP